MTDKPAVDVADTNVSADTDTPEFNLEEIMSKVEKLEEINTHLKESLDYQKAENRKAFEKRDRAIEQNKSYKGAEKDKDDLSVLIEGLQEQVKEKDNQLEEISNREISNRKLTALKDTAIKQGLKESYIDKLHRFVDLEDVDLEKPVSLRIAVDAVKNSYPDFFSANSEAVDRALPNPKLATGDLNYKEQYQKLLHSNPQDRKMDHFEKLAELKELLQG